MNHNSSGSLVLSKAITGFISYKMAEGLSNRSIDSYERILKKKWNENMGDIELTEISSQKITAYLSWLRGEYIPQRLNGKKHPLSPKTFFPARS